MSEDIKQDKSTESASGKGSAVDRLVILRCCASCEWVFKAVDNNPDCPKCGFGSYGARYVYGNAAYRFAKNQQPWLKKKLFLYEERLRMEIIE